MPPNESSTPTAQPAPASPGGGTANTPAEAPLLPPRDYGPSIDTLSGRVDLLGGEISALHTAAVAAQQATLDKMADTLAALKDASLLLPYERLDALQRQVTAVSAQARTLEARQNAPEGWTLDNKISTGMAVATLAMGVAAIVSAWAARKSAQSAKESLDLQRELQEAKVHITPNRMTRVLRLKSGEERTFKDIEVATLINLRNMPIGIITIGVCKGFDENDYPTYPLYHTLISTKDYSNVSFCPEMGREVFIINGFHLSDTSNDACTPKTGQKLSFEQWHDLWIQVCAEDGKLPRLEKKSDCPAKMTINEFSKKIDDKSPISKIEQYLHIQRLLDSHKAGEAYPYIFCQISTGQYSYCRRQDFEDADAPPKNPPCDPLSS